MLSNRFIRSTLAASLALLTPSTWAATTLAAVASDFTKPMAEVAEAFEKATGHSINSSFGSSGKFFAQIQNGAPFEVYMSANAKYPQELEKSGHAVANSSFTYALGRIVLWSPTAGLVDEQGAVLKTGNFQHLALADAAHAPYGVVAEETMQHLGLLDSLRPKFVLGENIAQTYQFVSSGNAELGFVALAQVIDVKTGKVGSGSGWIVPDNLHGPFKQTAQLLVKGAENPAAKAFIDFLKTPTARAIIQKYGFGLPE